MTYAKWPSAWKIAAKFEIHGSPDDVKFSLDSNIYKATINLTGVLNFAQDKTTYDSRLKNSRP